MIDFEVSVKNPAVVKYIRSFDLCDNLSPTFNMQGPIALNGI